MQKVVFSVLVLVFSSFLLQAQVVVPMEGNPVKGAEASVVKYCSADRAIYGKFVLKGDKIWEEENNEGKNFFEETMRDEWSVYLKDNTRNVSVQLDLWVKKVIIQPFNSEYIVTGAEKQMEKAVIAFESNKYYRITSQWQGDGKSLDVVNDGKNNQLQLANTGKYSGQYWKITPLGNGFYRLTTQWQGDGKSLDVVNDGKNNQLQLANTGNFLGQYWKITPLGNNFYRLTSKWQGYGKSLDVVNDGKNNKIQLANTANYSGQCWKIVPAQ